MPNESTPVLGLVKPEVNGPATENVWGYDLNSNFDKIDTRFGVLPSTDAPKDGSLYGRQMGGWTRIEDDVLTSDDITDFDEATDDRVATVLTAGPNILLSYDDTLGKISISSIAGEAGGGALVANGDYGDITVSGGGVAWAVDPKAITYAKIQDVTADRLLGRITGTGAVQEITCTAAGRALLDDADAAAQRATLGLSAVQPLDPTLTALAGLSGTGLIEQIGADVFSYRTIGVEANTSIIDRGAGDARYVQISIGEATTAPFGDNDTSIATTAFVQAAATTGQCRLVLDGVNLALKPYRGDKILINGVAQTVPSAGITLAPTSLTIDMNYYIYAYMSAGTMMLGASLTGHAYHASGVEIMIGDVTRTLVGLVRIITGPAFADNESRRLVRSWYNRPPLRLYNKFSAMRSTTSSGFVELNSGIRCQFVVFADDVLDIVGNVFAYNNVAGGYSFMTVGVDGPPPGADPCAENWGNGGSQLSWRDFRLPGEGFHYVSMYGSTAGGTSNFGDPSASNWGMLIGGINAR